MQGNKTTKTQTLLFTLTPTKSDFERLTPTAAQTDTAVGFCRLKYAMRLSGMFPAKAV